MRISSLLALGVLTLCFACDQEHQKKDITKSGLATEQTDEATTPEETPPITDLDNQELEDLEGVDDLLENTPVIVEQDQLDDTQDLVEQIEQPDNEVPDPEAMDSGLIHIVTVLVLLDKIE